MYKVYCDNNLIYDTRVSDLKLLNPKVTLELNKTGTFDFTIYPSHPHFEKLQKMSSIIKVYQNNKVIFRGRILNDEKGFYNQRQVTCEGELAFLNDTIIRPYVFEGMPEELFKKFIEEHNSQVDTIHQFKVGQCTVTDPNDYIIRSNSEYAVTWDELNKKLVEMLGGYLFVRYEEDGVYLDYLEDFNRLNAQTIELGRNLLDLKTITKGEDIFTVLIPLGAKVKEEIPEETIEETEEPTVTEDESKRLTIESVNEGKDYLEDVEAIKRFGRITKVMTWDDVTEPENLLRKGKEALASGFDFNVSLEISAVDLSGTGQNISSFSIGSYNKIKTKLHNLDETLLVQKLTINLDKPASDKLTLGATFDTFSEESKGDINNVENDFNIKFEEDKKDVIAQLERRLSTIIQSTIDGIITEVSEDYYLKSDAEELVQSISTQFEQTVNSFNFTFSEFKKGDFKDLQDSQSVQDGKFEEIKKYIKFVDGDILLGEEGNLLTLKIKKERISFFSGNNEVAYFSNSKLYVTDGEFLNSLRLGNFEFVPRDNGNLSFRKVGV